MPGLRLHLRRAACKVPVSGLLTSALKDCMALEGFHIPFVGMKHIGTEEAGSV